MKSKKLFFGWRWIPILVLGLVSILFSSVKSTQSIGSAIDPVEYAEIMAISEKLPHTGILKEIKSSENDRYIYLKVDERYITELNPLLKKERPLAPKAKQGAHISVILNQESQNLPEIIPELEKEYHFAVEKIKTLQVKKMIENQMKEVTWYIVIVKSPELSKFREKYHLPLLPHKNQQFHISFGEEVE